MGKADDEEIKEEKDIGEGKGTEEEDEEGKVDKEEGE